MSITLKLYAETFNGDRWHAKPAELYVEDIRGHLTGDSWIEPRSIYSARDDSLSEILGLYVSCWELPQITPQPRGFPDDISDELIDHFVRRHLPDWWKAPQDWVLLRQRARRLNFSQSWLLLSELLNFDWRNHQPRESGDAQRTGIELQATPVRYEFFNDVLPFLQTLGAPDRVRIVCWRVA
ncbi:MAG TPA: hypothetical protein V6C78_05305 [Crinalium sp.]|jgi:hypothetical protein